jgi:sec-independent protein translocase protein TatC
MSDQDEPLGSMTFLEHLEELRSRIIRALAGLGIAYAAALLFADQIWLAVSDPAARALRALGYRDELIILDPTDGFATVYIKLPVVAALFLSSPWALWQIWGFVAPGLYRREKRVAAPLIVISSLLFVGGGLFAYWVLFRQGLEFLLGIGKGLHAQPAISMVAYTDLFVNVVVGVGVLFEMPVAIFFLSLLRIVSASFLLANTRYAVLAIVVAAAFFSPTQDAYNLTLLAVPMLLLCFAGVGAAFALELQRGERQFPWLAAIIIALTIGATAAGLKWAVLR